MSKKIEEEKQFENEEIKQFGVVRTIVELLQPLDKDDQARIVLTVGTFLNLRD